MTSPIITPQQLKDQLQNDRLVMLDVSVPKVTGEQTDQENQTIPGAIVVDLKRDFSNAEGQFPNTVPSPEQFAETCGQLGITNESKVIVFDNLGVYSSPRVWWLFNIMGHQDVFVLDGGLPEWVNAGYPTIESIPWDRRSMKSPMRKFNTNYQAHLVKPYEDILSNVNHGNFMIADARSKGRFEGTTPEPREGIKSGHIPHSVCLPYQEVLDGHKFKSKAELQGIFNNLQIADTTVYSCGSGLTACIILLAGQIAGVRSMNVYDGSWTEWAELQGLKN